MHLTPSFNAVGALVLNARPSDVDTVLVDGEAVKRGGRLVKVDWASLRSRFSVSCERIHEGFLGLDHAVFEQTPPVQP